MSEVVSMKTGMRMEFWTRLAVGTCASWVSWLACASALAAYGSTDGDWLVAVNQLIDQRKYAQAVAALDEVVSKNAGDEAIVSTAFETKVRVGGLWMRKGGHGKNATPGLDLLRGMARGARSPFNENASWEIATSYLEMKSFDEAEASFQDFKDKFPLSPKDDEAAFDRALSVFMKVRKSRDPGLALLQAARDRFEEYIVDSGARAVEAQAAVQEIRQLQADQLWKLAEFYRKRHEPEASKIYLDRLRAEFADTEAGRRGL